MLGSFRHIIEEESKMDEKSLQKLVDTKKELASELIKTLLREHQEYHNQATDLLLKAQETKNQAESLAKQFGVKINGLSVSTAPAVKAQKDPAELPRMDKATPEPKADKPEDKNLAEGQLKQVRRHVSRDSRSEESLLSALMPFVEKGIKINDKVLLEVHTNGGASKSTYYRTFNDVGTMTSRTKSLILARKSIEGPVPVPAPVEVDNYTSEQKSILDWMNVIIDKMQQGYALTPDMVANNIKSGPPGLTIGKINGLFKTVGGAISKAYVWREKLEAKSKQLVS